MFASLLVAAGTTLHAAFLTFVAELGDKSYWLTIILAAWCPLAGLRDGRALPVPVQQALVALGAYAALMTRAALLRVGFDAAGGFLDLSLRVTMVWILVGLSIKAWLDLRRLDGGRFVGVPAGAPVCTSSEAAVIGDKIGSGDPAQVRWIGGGFLGDFKAYDPNHAAGRPPLSGIGGGVGAVASEVNPFSASDSIDYGAAPMPAVGLVKDEDDTGYDVVTLLCTSFVVPLVTVFMAESGDKSDYMLREALAGSADKSSLLHCVALGYFVAVVTTLMAGFLLERQLSERRLIFSTTLGLVVMAVVASSAAFLSVQAWASRSAADSTLMSHAAA
eukprot:TRINITY_DN13511_c0_g1_i1.p1 TRINITY_DN13511_c0_g1~~TRINITY_DN13511_c0_g1_i1.p1  ORF type:complete len:332 (+),score=70.07 TRINITY_DN13511_c0_g1_i1:87-1082(+)